MEWTVSWTFSGYTTVEADSEAAARREFKKHAMRNLKRAVEGTTEGPDIVSIDEE